MLTIWQAARKVILFSCKEGSDTEHLACYPGKYFHPTQKHII